MRAAVIRNLLYFVDALFCALIGYTSMSRSPRHRRVGDKGAGTVVVYARSLPADSTGSAGAGIALGLVAWTLINLLSMVMRAI